MRSGMRSALCVTSRPIIVTSRPLAKTRCGGLGVGPDVELGRRGDVPLGDRAAHEHDALDVLRRPRGSAARRSATFVSGPTGTSVTGRSEPRIRSARKSTACSVDRASLRRAAGRGRRGRSPRGRRAATNGSRRSGRSAPAATGTSLAPDELEHPERVRGRLLERLVARDGRDAEQLDLRAREGEQERDRVVVPGVAVEEDRDRSRARVSSSTSAAVGSDGCAPGREAAIAPAAQARRSASSRERPSRSETTRQAQNASPAAVPSTAVDRAAASPAPPPPRPRGGARPPRRG